MQTAGLHDKIKKCAFGLPKLEYLVHFVSKDGLKADPAKCHSGVAITNLGELQSFLGIANYYSEFVPPFG